MKSLMTKKLNRVLTLVLTFMALMAGQTAWAENGWDIQASTSGSVTTFTIKRTGDTSFKETVKYRLVNLSAYAGEHYYVTQVNGENKTTTEQQTAALSGDLTFNAGDNKKTVLVQEKAASTDATSTKRVPSALTSWRSPTRAVFCWIMKPAVSPQAPLCPTTISSV